MATLLFDIETIPQPWESFDVYTQAQLLRSHAEYSEKEVKVRLGLSPFTGSIVSVAFYDVERHLGAVYFVGEGYGSHWTDAGVTYKERSEKELLEDFWEGVQDYDVFVTVNVRAFDVPFLLHRSVVHGVKPVHVFNHSRYITKQSLPYHVDLLDELTMYGAMGKRPSLHLACLAYGIESKKGEVDGSNIAELFRQKKFRDIARHNIDDVMATYELYEKWKQYLAPASFINAIEL